MDLVLYRTFLGWFNQVCNHYWRLGPLFYIYFSKLASFYVISIGSGSASESGQSKKVLKFDLIGSRSTPMLRIRQDTLIKKKIKFSSYIRKFRVEQLQSHIWGFMRICANISLYMRRPLVIYNFAICNCSILLIYEENLIFFFISAKN
jgi:hypothetical protein